MTRGAATAPEPTGEVITSLPRAVRARWHVDHMVTTETTVHGRPASYAVGGRGLPVLFLHGWGLDHRAYRRSLLRLTSRGCRVIAPSLPGFGGTAALPSGERTIGGFAAWVAALVDEIGVDGPMVVLGHSFGGGVATKLVHDHPHLARYLVILNSVGDPRSFAGGILDRFRDPLSLFSLDPVQFVLPTADGATLRLIPRVFVENVLRDPLAVADAGRLAMTADLGAEMASLADRGLPTLVLWSDNDGVIPMSAFETFCSTFGGEGQVVAGGHSWLLASPDVFGQVLDNVVHVQASHDRVDALTATTAELRELLRPTTVPEHVVGDLLDGISPLWAMSAPSAVLAADLTLCHPRLRRHEVRAVARRVRGTDSFRLTVVARDRPGLLADSASVLADEGLSVLGASATTWPDRHQALHSFTVRADHRLDAARWRAIGERLRVVASGGSAPTPFVATGRASVTVTGAGAGGSVVRVTARDRIGLLAAVCHWFAAAGISVQAANVETIDGVAKDVFIVDGPCDVDELVRHLSRKRSCPLRPLAHAVLAPAESHWA